MSYDEMNKLLRRLLVDGGIVTVPFDEMRYVRDELNRFCVPPKIEILDSDFNKVTFRELLY